MEPKWLEWCRILQGVAQTGLHYAKHFGEVERYTRVRRVAAEMMAAGSGATVEYIEGLFGANTGYATPQVTVRGVVFKDLKVLLVRERSGGLWALPGGYAEIDDSPSEAVTREILEETNCLVEVKRLLAVYSSKHKQMFHKYDIFFQCEIIGGEPMVSDEISGISFFSESELPRIATVGNTLVQVRRFYDFLRDPSLLADFD